MKPNNQPEIEMNNTYWNHKGLHQEYANMLEQLIPSEGSVINPIKNKKIEKFRKAANCYYDLYNNGLINYSRSFAKIFGFSSRGHKYPTWARAKLHQVFDPQLYTLVEKKMDEIIIEAAIEQGLI